MDSPKRALRLLVALNLLLIVAAVLAGLNRSGNPSRYFGDGRALTYFSSVQLLVVAYLSYRIFRERQAAPGLRWWNGPVLWALIASGFVVLAFDQAFDWHNKIDKVIHKTLHLEKTALTDRFDDAIIGGYGLIGIGVMWAYRREVMQFAAARKPLFWGFVCLFIQVIFDAASNQRDVADWLTGDVTAAKRLQGWMAAAEGGFTLVAEALFMAAFYHAWRLSAVARAALARPESGAAMQPVV